MNYHSENSRYATDTHSAATVTARRQAQDLARIICARRRRQQFFRTQLFSDPAWDILLVLALAELNQQRLSVSAVCAAADAPYTTAQRYTQALIEGGLVTRVDDPLDGRRKFLMLSAPTSKQMSAYLNSSALFELKAA